MRVYSLIYPDTPQYASRTDLPSDACPGAIAYVQDEDSDYVFVTSGWERVVAELTPEQKVEVAVTFLKEQCSCGKAQGYNPLITCVHCDCRGRLE